MAASGFREIDSFVEKLDHLDDRTELHFHKLQHYANRSRFLDSNSSLLISPRA